MENAKMKLIIPSGANEIIEKLNNLGFEAYAVGGCVRDALLGKIADDWDITTSALPEQVVDAFSYAQVIPTGIKHGTVTVRINGENYEVTTFRTDGEYKDSRHPEKVDFVTSLSEDLKRRDFTVNAMAYSEKSGLIDLFGGLNDLNNKIIRAVGDPKQRFLEDALRILRGVRFLSTTGFEIEENTYGAMKEKKALLKNVSAERIFTEIDKMLLGDFVDKALLSCSEIIFEIFPELAKSFNFLQHSKWHLYNVYTHTAIATKSVAKKRELRWCMLFHDVGKPDKFFLDDKGEGHFYGHPQRSKEIAENIFKRLKFATKLKQEVLSRIVLHDKYLPTETKKLKMVLRDFGEELTLDLFEIKRADNTAQGTNLALAESKKVNDIEKTVRQIIESGECYSLKTLAVTGDDLIALGFSGKEIGNVLKRLLNDVICGNIPNEKQRLLKSAKKGKVRQ